MAKVTYVLAQGENSAGESQVNFRVYVSRESRVRVPSGIWVDRRRWGKKNDINIPNIPGDAPFGAFILHVRQCRTYTAGLSGNSPVLSPLLPDRLRDQHRRRFHR